MNDEFLLGMYRNKLEQCGFQVIGFERLPDNLVEVITGEQPNLIFLDMMISDKNDFDIIKLLKENPLTKDFLVVSLTGLMQKGYDEYKHNGMLPEVIQYQISSDRMPSNVVMKLQKIMGLSVNCAEKNYFSQKDERLKEAISARQELKNDIYKTKLKPGEARKKIIMLDDDDFFRNMYIAKLESANFNVIAFRFPPQDIIDIIAKEKPDLISSDIIMPFKDGLTLLKELKDDVRTKNIPVCMLTNLGQKGDIEKGLKLGAVKYLVLSQYTPDEVINIFREVLGLPLLSLSKKSGDNSKPAGSASHFPPYTTFPSDEEVNKLER